ncbi:MAG: acylneuraminate cytidylyltransferase family protein, partial [Candidatus Eisenbacteria bacterium]
MIRAAQVVAVVPARGGSKGIPRKNLARLGGRTLVERAIDVARAVECIDRILVSTDDGEIARVAMAAGAEVHVRPSEMATDTSKVVEALRHLCDTMLDPAGAGNAMVVLLEPTCPFRSAADVSACIARLAAGGCDAVATFTPAKVNPWRTWAIEEDRPRSFIPGANPWLPRQQLPPAYQLSGAVYAFWRDNLRNPTHEVLCGEIRAVIIPAARSFDIDGPLDL